jgi:hypothetical protein
MGKNAFQCKPILGSSKNSKICEKAYKLTACLQGARDLWEEYLAARVWPLKKGWDFVRYHKNTVRGKDYLFPDKEVLRPVKFDSDKDFVASIEKKAVGILGKFLKKEKDLLEKTYWKGL